MYGTSFLSGGFTTMAVINPPERKLAKRISVDCTKDSTNQKFTHFCAHKLKIVDHFFEFQVSGGSPLDISLKLMILLTTIFAYNEKTNK